jgi:hypothetical protein
MTPLEDRTREVAIAVVSDATPKSVEASGNRGPATAHSAGWLSGQPLLRLAVGRNKLE